MGFQSFVRSMVEQAVFAYQRKFVFYHPILTDDSSDVPLNPEFTYRLATADDVPSLKAFRAIYQPEQFAEWIREGDFVFLALKNQLPVAFQVVSKRSRTRMPYAAFQLEDGQAWVVDIYTLPEFRDHHAAFSLRKFRERTLSELGFCETVATIRERNVPSLRMAHHSRFRIIRYYRYIRLFGFHTMKIEEDARGRFEAIIANSMENQSGNTHGPFRH